MRRGKHRIKQEMADGRSAGGGVVGKAGGSATAAAPVEERELAYYIHDRVELMHQVFSILRSRELRAMTPDCVKNLSTDDLQELCLEELLGISSKRLCAVLDGADPPSDTSSSESERLETVSLDSISSVDELSERDEPQKRKRKCKRKEAKAKNAAGKPSGQPDNSANKSAYKTAGTSANKSGGAVEKVPEGGDSRAAERAGMTVLELLELQARARAIRAQLALEHSRKAVAADAPPASGSPAESEDSDGGVEIKEEPAEVVELVSSDEEDRKPPRGSLPDPPAAGTSPTAPQSTITKRNDLTIIVPNAQKHRKVKLNRTKSVTVTAKEINTDVESPTAKISDPKHTAGKSVEKIVETVHKTAEKIKDKEITDKAKAGKESEKTKALKKKKPKKKKKTNSEGRDGSDHDEITLQLSDSEKMDLLEDFDRKNYDNVSSSDSEESSSDSGQSSNESGKKHAVIDAKETEKKGEVINDQESENNGDVSEAKNGGLKKSGEKQNEEIDNNIKKTIETTKDEADGTIVIEENNKNETDTLDNEVAGSENNLVKNTDYIESNQTDLVEEENVEQDKINEEDLDKFALNESENKDHEIESNAKKSSKTVEESKEESQIVISSINDIPLRVEIVNIADSNKNLDQNKEPEVVNAEQSNTDDNTEEITEKQNTYKSTAEITEKNKEEQRDHIENTETSGNENKEKSIETENKKASEPKTDTDKEMSDGEVSDRTSSEIEIFEKPSEVVCISDDDDVPKKKEKKKKKDKSKKKEKKAKKDKKDKKSDFCERADQNFFEKKSTIDVIVIDSSETALSKRLSIDSHNSNSTIEKAVSSPDYSSVKVDSDSEDIYEICEISDDNSSCYEVEGISVLSKEPTSEEIEALSAKIDTEIEREDVITDEQIQQHDNQDNISAHTETDNLEDVSWKDRWLGSTKVKKVLKTSNILNAMRKKNKELKKKLAESKCKEEKSKEVIIEEPIAPVEEERSIEEGSITQFNTLQGSTQFVDPVKEPKAHDELIAAIKEAVGQTANGSKEETTEETLTEEKEKEEKPNVEGNVTNQEGEGTKPDLDVEMKKDAKQLLKMYKRLLKYNNMNKETDPNKVKKKKTKKQKKNKEKKAAAVVTA